MSEQEYFAQFSGEGDDEVTLQNNWYAELFNYDISNGLVRYDNEYFALIEETKRKRANGEQWEKIGSGH